MNNDWPRVPIVRVAKPVLGGTPSRNQQEYWDGDIPWASAKDISSVSGRFIHSTTESISHSGLEHSPAKLLPRGTVVITARGTVGALAQLGSPMTFNQTCYGFVTFDENDQDYLYYALKSTLSEMRSLTYGTVFDTITMESFKHWYIPYPSKPNRRAIAHILSSLDDKIELNRRMNNTLESIARAIFKSWFIDFDPVCARVEGRETGLPPHIVDLFPDAFVKTELGEIPREWSLSSYLDLADLLSGGTPKTSVPEYWDGGVPWVSAKDVSNANDLFIITTEKTISELGLNNSSTKLLPAYTTIVTARGTVGANCMLGREMAMNQTNYGLKAKPGVGDFFIFFSLQSLVDHFRRQSYGTIFDTITTKTFDATLHISPPKELLSVFNDLVEPIMVKILSNVIQSQILASLRDTLLPRLVSGQLRVRETEKFISRVI